MRRSEMAARLANHEVEARLTACRQELVTGETTQQSAASEAGKDFKRQVLTGPLTRILWRRSPKE